MKRIIDGVTYNTDTSTVIARSEFIVKEEGPGAQVGDRLTATLYQTRGGAFFLHHFERVNKFRMRTETWEEVEQNEFEVLTRDEAHSWVLRGEIELLNNVFGEPPEAVAEAVPAATMYVRIPTSLKEQAEKNAAETRISLNSWVMRCVERCVELDEIGLCLGGIIATGLALDVHDDPADGLYFDSDTLTKMVYHMQEQAAAAAKLLGWDGEAIEQLATAAGGTIHDRTWSYELRSREG